VDWKKPENTLDFSLVKDPLDQLLKATEANIQREWPLTLGNTVWHGAVFDLSLKIARWTYVASLYLLSDKPEDIRRHLEYAVVVPPLNRTILDMVISVVFVFDDFHDRLCWYFQHGVGQMEERLTNYRNIYGALPEWDQWFKYSEGMITQMKANRDLVCVGQYAHVGYFPHPGKILGKSDKWFKDPRIHEYLVHLNLWFYRQLSSSSHNHFDGLLEKAAQILRIESKEETQIEFAKKYKSDCMLTQITLVLCLVSEIIAAVGFDNKAKADYVWGILQAYWTEAQDLYQMRYRDLLR
jgi:hypothetical protein